MVMQWFQPPVPDILSLHQAQLGAQAEKERLARYKTAFDAYEGRMPDSLKATKTDLKAADNVTIAYGRLVVDTVVAWLFGHEPTFSIDVADTGTEVDDTDSPEEQWLDDVWKQNKKMLLLQKLAMNGAICGHTFVKLRQGTPQTKGLPRIIVLDPATVSVFWSDEDIDEVNEYRIQWSVFDAAGKARTRRQRITPDGDAWLITDEISRLNSTAWDKIGTEVWPFPFAPIAHTQHLPMPNEFYGHSELEEFLLCVNRAINFKASNNNRIERIHGHPRTWGRGFQSREVEVSPDSMIVFNNKDAELKNLEMQSDMSGNQGNLDRLMEAFFRLARVPLLAIGDVSGISSGLSGVALALYFKPLLQKTETLRMTYGAFLIDLNEQLLAIGRKPEAQCAIDWPELLPRDPVQERQALQIDHELGVSSYTILEKLGYDPEQEKIRSDEEKAATVEAAQTAFDRGQGQLTQPVNGDQAGQQPPDNA